MTTADLFLLLLLGLLLLCGLSAVLTKNLLVCLIIFMAYSVLMSVVWAMLQAPDLAITEAAVGVGISGILLFVTLKKLQTLRKKAEDEKDQSV
ncbi:MAG: DUF4040 domain-containing protein [Oscillospiraceae bacterium]|nr:DUF4040 domain-containing protein [Oscillospiraceae bacterium]